MLPLFIFMKNKTFFLSVILFLLVTFSCCSKDENNDNMLHFEKDYYEIPINNTWMHQIEFTGDGNYTAETTDESVLTATVNGKELIISPKQKGVANVTVKDEKLMVSSTLRIKVVDSYLCFSVSSPAHQPFSKGNLLFLVDSSDKDFYLYDDEENLTDKGYYKIYVKNNTPYLALHSNTLDAVYDISGSTSALWQIFDTVFGKSWQMSTSVQAMKTRADMSVLTMNAVDIETSAGYYFVLKSNKEMPYNTLSD